MLGTHRLPIAATYAVFGSVGETAMRAIVRVPSRPTCFHVEPPLVERHTPLPHCELFRSFASPVPTHTTLESLGATATAPMEATGWSAKTASKVAPSFVVFITPPVARPT